MNALRRVIMGTLPGVVLVAGCQPVTPAAAPDMIVPMPIATVFALLAAGDVRENRGRIPIGVEAQEVQQVREGNTRVQWSVIDGEGEARRLIVNLASRGPNSTAVVTQVFVTDLRGGLSEDEDFTRISELSTFREWVDATVHRRRYDEVSGQRQWLRLYDAASPEFQRKYRELGERARVIVESGVMPDRYRYR